MGEPGPGCAGSPHAESIGVRGEPGELKHLSSPRKRKRSDSVSSGERKRNSLNSYRVTRIRPLRYGGSGKYLPEP